MRNSKVLRAPLSLSRHQQDKQTASGTLQAIFSHSATTNRRTVPSSVLQKLTVTEPYVQIASVQIFQHVHGAHFKGCPSFRWECCKQCKEWLSANLFQGHLYWPRAGSAELKGVKSPSAGGLHVLRSTIVSDTPCCSMNSTHILRQSQR